MGVRGADEHGERDSFAERLVRDLAAYRSHLREWLVVHAGELPAPASAGASFKDRLNVLQPLQRLLYEHGWARYGWPEAIGGLGGDARHRAVLYEELAAAGHPSRSAYEHLEILAPALLVHWDTASFAAAFRLLLDGTELWSQGFSEPDAGSDMADLSTRAVADGDGYRITGRKIWTSWAVYARRCVVLARTGTRAERHRGLTAFFVDLDASGVAVHPIRQANGIDELAEVTFDDVWVDASHRIGVEGSGWQFAMDVLSCERSAFAWLRQVRLQSAFGELCHAASSSADYALGDVALDLFALRCSSAHAVRSLAAGQFLGPDAAPVKLALTNAEQRLYDVAHRVLGPGLTLGDPTIADVAAWQEDYLFSRAVSIYGGTRQMQLTTVARLVLGLPNAPKPRPRSEMFTVACGVLAHATSGADALHELEWTPKPAIQDPAWREMFAALFRAQGYVRAVTPALGSLVAAAMLGDAFDPDAHDLFGVVGAASATRSDDEVRLVLVGAANASRVLVNLPDGGWVIDASDLVSSDGAALDAALVTHASVPTQLLRPIGDPDGDADARTIAQVACALEILGACEYMMDVAVAYACDRRQFNAPIGSFQALQHLLAAAAAELCSLEHACNNTLDFVALDASGAREAALLKALAGRTARHVLQATLQTLGGIGFTWEHEHHHFARRALTLDALYGGVDELLREFGADARLHGPVHVNVFDAVAPFDLGGNR